MPTIPNYFVHRKGSKYFDPITGLYVDTETGICEDSADGEPAVVGTVESEKLDPVFPAWIEDCKELMEIGALATSNESWKTELDVNPDVEIGQTLPFVQNDDYHDETIVRKEDRYGQLQKAQVPKWHPDYGKVRTYELTQQLADGAEHKRVPDCASIEHKQNPIYSEKEVPKNPELFHCLYLLFDTLLKTPQATYWKWLPVLVDFLINHINVIDQSGEISIPELLSTFRSIKSDKDKWRHLFEAEVKHAKQLNKKRKTLQSKVFGHKKF